MSYPRGAFTYLSGIIVIAASTPSSNRSHFNISFPFVANNLIRHQRKVCQIYSITMCLMILLNQFDSYNFLWIDKKKMVKLFLIIFVVCLSHAGILAFLFSDAARIYILTVLYFESEGSLSGLCDNLGQNYIPRVLFLHRDFTMIS